MSLRISCLYPPKVLSVLERAHRHLLKTSGHAWLLISHLMVDLVIKVRNPRALLSSFVADLVDAINLFSMLLQLVVLCHLARDSHLPLRGRVVTRGLLRPSFVSARQNTIGCHLLQRPSVHTNFRCLSRQGRATVLHTELGLISSCSRSLRLRLSSYVRVRSFFQSELDFFSHGLTTHTHSDFFINSWTCVHRGSRTD